MTFVDAVRAQMRLAIPSRAVLFGTAICVLPWVFNVAITELSREVLGAPDIGPELLISPAGGLVCLALGVVWGMLVWRDEPPRTRFYHWSLPMDTSTHDLARVVAFLLWFLLALVLYMLAGMAVMAFYGVPLRFDAVGIVPWLCTYLAGVIGYLIGAAYSTAFERPVEYVFGTMILVWGLLLISVLYGFQGLRSLLFAIFGGPGSEYGLFAAVSNGGVAGISRYVTGRPYTEYLPVTGPLMLWLAVGVTAVLSAAFWNRGRVR